ncbi:MAG: geranylgeranyl reductase family protein [Pseudomonadota bacterium]|uniref:NAD(P)/FAD-dependent oxidoreductase n=1 Tax=Alcanivorax sp. TaxID=1872427 RepID=UPI00243C480C|nr:geranylgeranyl reductase family protein [Alcanivorax sp.]MED5239320.1 geranylgeranyl reductase family protein [Pseudomonadota bacterium]MEE3321971.1 geranylgeranyl reductase family protein [Pseudomonadota bacterium]
MNTWDVMVVGAGQAGCAAAWDLAAAGLRVLVLSRAAGAGKPCAGGVTMKTLNRYRFSIAPVARETIDTLHISRYPRQPGALKAPDPFCVMTERSELDAYCLSQAQEQGAEFRLTRGIERVRQDHTGVSVTTREGESYQADYLIAADGANSRVRHLLGERAWQGAMAIEGHIKREDLTHYPGMTLDFQAIKGGYGWLFPKGDHVNVGLYIWKHGLAATDRKALDQYCLQKLGVKPHKVSGFPLGTWLPGVRLMQARILFAGDAAGCTEALLGEGIYGAVLSGQLAAEAILSGSPQDYPGLLEEWRDELARVRQLSALFYGLLPLSVPILKGSLGETLVEGFSRGYTLGQCKRRWRGAASLA